MPSPRTRPDVPRWGAVWGLAFGLATFLGWSTVALMHFGMIALGRPLPLRVALMANLPDWYFWAALSPAVFWLAWRLPIERTHWVRASLLHLGAGAIVALTNLALVTGFNRVVGTPSFAGPFWEVYPRTVLRYLPFAFIIYWVIVAAAHATRYYRSFRQQELEASELARQLSQAQLATLRMQLQPHFFFNTLHTIAGLVREGRGAAATRTIAQLGDLFRQTLGRLQENEIPLREELTLVRAYLDIEQLRFEDRLSVQVDVDSEALSGLVPSLGLQPIVENAIRHGIACDPAARRLAITARRAADVLRIEIHNDGPTYTPPAPRVAGNGGEGVGLTNTRARFDRLYGSSFRLDIGPASRGEGGALVRIEIPWRTEDQPGG